MALEPRRRGHSTHWVFLDPHLLFPNLRLGADLCAQSSLEVKNHTTPFLPFSAGTPLNTQTSCFFGVGLSPSSRWPS